MANIPIWSLKNLVNSIQARVFNDFDAVICIEGKRGLGKSTLGYKILKRLQVAINFKPNRDIIYKREGIIRHLASKKQGCILADEMIGSAYSRDFYVEEQKTLIKALNMYRDNLNAFVFCIPFFSDLDTQFKKLVAIRITVVRRGLALIHLPRPSIFSSDIWDTKYNEKIERKWTNKFIQNPMYSQLTTVVGYLHFGDLSPKAKELYLKIKQEKRGKIYSEYLDGDMPLDPEELFYINLKNRVKAKVLTPRMFNEICKVNGRKYENVRRRINRMLEDTGEKGSFRDYVNNSNLIKKKDSLGFSAD